VRTKLLVVVLLAVGGTTIVAAGHASATLPADVEVVDETCTAGRISAVTLSVTYYGDTPITVHSHTWDEERHIQYAWRPKTITLEPGTQQVQIQAPVADAQLTPAAVSQVYLNHGQQRAIYNWRSTTCSSRSGPP